MNWRRKKQNIEGRREKDKTNREETKKKGKKRKKRGKHKILKSWKGNRKHFENPRA